jgi:hypothetical protein
MPFYSVRLEVLSSAACVGSTLDTVEAEDAESAELDAMKSWSLAKPGHTFRPLLTVQVEQPRCASPARPSR